MADESAAGAAPEGGKREGGKREGGEREGREREGGEREGGTQESGQKAGARKDTQQQAAPQTSAKEPALGGMLLRDGVALAAVLAIWGGAEAWAAVSGLVLAQGLSVVNGIAAGLVVVSLLHEWGHYAGAKLTGAIAPRNEPRGLASLFRFQFDLANNTLRQFTALGVGGNVAHWLAFLALFAFLPLDTVGQTALVAAALSFAFGASVLEVPIITRALKRTVEPIHAFDHLSRAVLHRHVLIGGIGGLAFAAVA